MKKIQKLFLPLLAFLIPSKKPFANVQIPLTDEMSLTDIERNGKEKTPILYKFFSEDNKIIQFIRHSSHRSHRSHSSGSYGNSKKHYSHYSSSYGSDDSTKKEPANTKKYSNPEYTNKEYAYASQDLNVRKEPNASSELVTSIKQDTKVKILSQDSDPWFKIEVNGYTGYVNSKYLYY